MGFKQRYDLLKRVDMKIGQAVEESSAALPGGPRDLVLIRGILYAAAVNGDLFFIALSCQTLCLCVAVVVLELRRRRWQKRNGWITGAELDTPRLLAL